MMPWLLVAGDFTPFGGMDSANYALAQYLAKCGNLHLVTHRVSTDLAAQPGVTVHRVLRPLGWHFLGGSLLSQAGRRTWQNLSRGGVRTIVNGGNCPLGVANWLHYLHAAHQPETSGSLIRSSKTRLMRKRNLAAEQIALREASIVICNSRRTRDDVVERVGIEAHRAHVVYYGADPVKFSVVSTSDRADAKRELRLDPDRPLVGFVGALGDRRKGFDTLFAAWTELCRRPNWDADLMVVGAGAEIPQWKQRAREAGLADRMTFAGYRHDMPAVMAAFDVLVHPARYEAYGLSVHEALCRGVPAFVNASSGVAERYSPNLSELLITNPDDPVEIADRLTKWRSDGERFACLVAPLSRQLRARSWNEMAQEIVHLVERAEAA
jgi:glycosyltransferase involved in cell wall biosynthesis